MRNIAHFACGSLSATENIRKTPPTSSKVDLVTVCIEVASGKIEADLILINCNSSMFTIVIHVHHCRLW